MLIPWLIRHAACCTNMFQLKANEKTAYFSQRGREYNGGMIAFGEVGMFNVITEDKFEDRFEKGISIGKSEETDEYFYLTESGFKKSRTAKRPCEGERLNVDLLSKIQGLP